MGVGCLDSKRRKRDASGRQEAEPLTGERRRELEHYLKLKRYKQLLVWLYAQRHPEVFPQLCLRLPPSQGWIQDRSGTWVKDENVEFDSDEEDPPSLLAEAAGHWVLLAVGNTGFICTTVVLQWSPWGLLISMLLISIRLNNLNKSAVSDTFLHISKVTIKVQMSSCLLFCPLFFFMHEICFPQGMLLFSNL